MSLKHVDAKTAHELQSNDDHTYVDVRSIPEFENGHPAGARNVPLLNLDRQTGQMRPNPEFLAVMQANYPPESKLLIGCQMGGRSAQAGQVLVTAGYQNIANVLGGFGGAQDRMTGEVVEGWVDAGLPVERDAPPENGYEALRRKASGSSQ
jgi:E3 ubiquitin-protein ligase RNF13